MQRVDMHHSHANALDIESVRGNTCTADRSNHVYLLLDCMWSRDTHEDG